MVNLKSSVLLISSICLSAALCFFKEEENTFMSYDPTQQSSGSPPYGQPQPPAQPPQQPAGTPPPYPPTQLAGTPPYGQPPQPPTAYGRPPQTPAGTPPPYQPTQLAGPRPPMGRAIHLCRHMGSHPARHMDRAALLYRLTGSPRARRMGRAIHLCRRMGSQQVHQVMDKAARPCRRMSRERLRRHPIRCIQLPRL